MSALDWVILAAAFAALWLFSGEGAAAPAAARPLLHPLFTDHMVLQRDRPVPVWGWTKPGARVTAAMGGRSATTKAGRDGRWELFLGPYPAGGPHVLTVTGPGSATVQDVLAGDVWLCSGQSNMQMGIAECRNAREEIAAADHAGIRLFTVPMRISAEPEPVPDACWETCTPQNVSRGGWGGFSGVAYFFGRTLQRELGVPVGLIHAAWGGTVAEAWASRSALAALPDFRGALAALERDRESWARGAEEFEREVAGWWKQNDPGSAAVPGWEAPDLEDADWPVMTLPTKWEEAGLPGFDGVVWFRRRVTLPAAWAGQELTLCLGRIDDRDVSYMNGVKVGAMDLWDRDRVYTVPGAAVRAGESVLAVRVLDTGAAGGMYGPAADMWVAPAEAPAAERIALTGGWKYRPTADLRRAPFPQRLDANSNRVTVLSNGMIEPLVPFALKGAIWYQGESNAGRAEQYRRLLPALIRDWRGRFRSGDFPFLIVQLANFGEAPQEPGDDAWAELREAQFMTAATAPNAGLAVAVDIGDAADIHPKNKQDVGKRLALAALRIAYGRDGEYSGPVFRSMTVAGSEARLQFDHAAGLRAADGGPVRGFTVADAAGAWAWADARVDGESVVVAAESVPAPARIRYAWAANPSCNLVNGAGLPAVPFRTDAPARVSLSQGGSP